jgi:peptide/nickel transport system permease protein
MSDKDSSIEADGGIESIEGLFQQLGDTSGYQLSRRERLSRTLDTYVFTPLRITWSDWRMRIGLGILIFYFFMGTIGTSIVPEPVTFEHPQFQQPFQSMQYPLGTDIWGQSIWENLVHATPAMLKMLIAGAVVASGTGAIIGAVAGYKGGAWDSVLMFLTDIVLTMPGLPLIIVLASIIPMNDPFVVGIILAVDNWPGLARNLRSQVLTIRQESYVEAARAMDQNTFRILQRDVIPQVMPYVLINAANAAKGVIFESTGLYFLGLLPFTTFNWGVMMNLARQNNAVSNPGLSGHWLFWPVLALLILSFGLILTSQGLDRVFNPRLRARHAKKTGGEEAGEVPQDV